MTINKPVVLVLGATVGLFAASVLLRFVLLSQSGLSGGWIFYLGLPIGGIGVLALLLLRLRLLNFGERSSTPMSRRLEELENLRASGAISDAEYIAERARIISSV